MAVSGHLQDFTEDVNCAFEFLLKLTPLLDKADQRSKYELPCSPFSLCRKGFWAFLLLFCLLVHFPWQEQAATAQ